MRIFSIFLLSMCLSGCSYLPLGNKRAPIYPPQNNTIYYYPIVNKDNNANPKKRKNIDIPTKEESQTELPEQYKSIDVRKSESMSEETKSEETDLQELQELEKKSPNPRSSQLKPDEENMGKKITPYQKDGKWVYPNVNNGKPVSTSYKLQLN